MSKTRVIIAIEFERDGVTLDSVRVADYLRRHADFIDDSVRRGDGPDETGVQAIDDHAQVHWQVAP